MWTESGEPICIVHVQYYKAVCTKQQLLNRHGCALGHLGVADRADAMAEGAMDVLYRFFLKNLRGVIRIDETKAYSTNGYPDRVLKPSEIV